MTRSQAGRRARSRRALGLLALLLLANPAGGGQPAGAAPADACPDTPHRFETFALPAPALGRAKQILVYLPPGYDCAGARRYPVLYLNDGHDLFEWSPFTADLDPVVAAEIGRREAWYGSWRLDAQLDRAIADGALPPLIVVGIASDDGMRSRDLAPAPWDGSAEARGPQYADFIALTVVATIEARFRAAPSRHCRGIGGASLGGISALQIGLTHPDTFALVLAFSPVLADPALAANLAAAWPSSDPVADPGDRPAKFLIDLDDDPVGRADHAWLSALVAATATPGRQTTLRQTPAGRHSIASWAQRALPALTHLLTTPCSA